MGRNEKIEELIGNHTESAADNRQHPSSSMSKVEQIQCAADSQPRTAFMVLTAQERLPKCNLVC